MSDETDQTSSNSEAETETEAEKREVPEPDETLSGGPSSIEELADISAGDPVERAINEIKSEIDNLSGNDEQELGNVTGEDRDRGILTPADRNYLWEESDYEHIQSKYKAQERIQNRVWNAILDFVDLELKMNEENRSEVFERDDKKYLHNSIVMAFSFFYRGLDCDSDTFESIVEQAVYEAETRTDHQQEDEEIPTVDVTIEIERSPDLGELKKELTKGEPLTDREIGALVRNDALSEEQRKSLVDQPREVATKRVLRHRLTNE